MTTVRKFLVAVGLLAVLPLSAAHAGGFIGISVGIPVGHCYRPYGYGYYPGYYYYRPYPAVVVAPPPVVLTAPVVETIPVQPAYPAPVAVAPTPALAPVPTTTIRATSGETRQSEIDHCLAHLGNPDEKVRADMAIQLGRMHAVRAAEALASTLSTDRSPAVRDAAARALGLIGSHNGLAALDRAAQSDDDRDVRRSAQYAAEVVRSKK